MWKVYVVASVVLFVLASAAAVWLEISPPQQHGRGMGAALLSAYVVIGWIVAAVNVAVMASLAYFRWVRRPG